MADKIVYTSNDHGIEGREPQKAIQAAYSQESLESLKKRDKSLAWRSDDKVIIDVERRIIKALSKLDGIDRLVLDLPQQFTGKLSK